MEGPPRKLLRRQQHIEEEVTTEVISIDPLVSFIDMGLFMFYSVCCETWAKHTDHSCNWQYSSEDMVYHISTYTWILFLNDNTVTCKKLIQNEFRCSDSCISSLRVVNNTQANIYDYVWITINILKYVSCSRTHNIYCEFRDRGCNVEGRNKHIQAE